jgi:hypothetical protein
MVQSSTDPNELLQTMAAKAVEHGETLRQSVRDMTLRALSTREATLEQLNKVLQSVTAGVSQGAAISKADPAQLFKDALAGMDEAVVKVVEANQIALQKLAGDHGQFEQSQFKKTLDDMKHLEGQFVGAVQQAVEGAGAQIKTAWGPVLEQMKVAGSQTGAQAQEFAESFARNVNDQLQASRETAFKAAHALTQNYAAVVSGVLMGLAEAYQQKGQKKT